MIMYIKYLTYRHRHSIDSKSDWYTRVYEQHSLGDYYPGNMCNTFDPAEG